LDGYQVTDWRINERLSIEVKENAIQLNNLKIAYLKHGDGDQLVVFLHGFPDRADSMKLLMDELADENHTLVAPYMRGYAPSNLDPQGSYFLCDFADDVVRLIEELGYESAIIVGHDWGAPTAYAAANYRPQRVDAVVGMAVPPLPVFLAQSMVHPQQFRRSWYMFYFQLPLIPQWNIRKNDFALIDWFYENWSPDLKNRSTYSEPVKDMFQDSGRLEAALGYYRALFRGAFTDPSRFRKSLNLSFGRPSAPALVLAGENDGCIDPSVFEGTEMAFDGPAEFMVVPDAGHFMHVERPEYLGEKISPFLNQT